eukprot:gene8443-11421_t
MGDQILQVEQLIATIARAFYSDTVVVMIDALLREKYIIEEEFGPRLKLQSKDIRKYITQLEEYEMLIKHEIVTINPSNSGDTKNSKKNTIQLKCYYIDYQTCFYVIKYRLYLLEKLIHREEHTELTEIYFQCPNCKEKYTILEVQKYRAKDNKFICPSCCPADNYKIINSETYFRLVQVDNKKELNHVQQLDEKRLVQLSSTLGRIGIYDLINGLKNAVLPHNLPSENMFKGVQSTRITDNDTVLEIEHNRAINMGGGDLQNKKRSLQTSLALDSFNKMPKFSISIEPTADIVTNNNDSNSNNNSNVIEDAPVNEEEVVWEDDD